MKMQSLKLVTKTMFEVSSSQMEIDHNYLIDQYITSHYTRNHSIKTITREKSFLSSWFNNFSDLYSWNAMEPIYGRERIVEYANTLIDSGISHHTIRAKISILSRFFSYVLEHPYVKHNSEFISIEQLYGEISQPISEYDIPKHSYDGEQLGVPLDSEDLLLFFNITREHYLVNEDSMAAAIRARYYSMTVIAGLCGLRIDEILHLDLKKDVFFKSAKIQTRNAKATRGSGKRSRITLFPPLARDTLKYYINRYRHLLYVGETDLLFPSNQARPLSYSSVNNALNEMILISNKNKVPVAKHMSWHWFRRIFATRFIEQHPHQLSILIHLLGHTSPNTVHKYIKHSEAWMDKKILKVLQGDIL